jgi:hypothetical protein
MDYNEALAQWENEGNSEPIIRLLMPFCEATLLDIGESDRR